MYINEVMYYAPNSKPDFVRIISESLGFDITVIPKLHQNEFYYRSLVELAKCPEIDHIYASGGPIYCYDEVGDPPGFGELWGQKLDVCDGYLYSTEELEEGKKAMIELLAKIDREYRKSIGEEVEE